MRRWPARLGLVVGGLALALALAEGGLRLYGWWRAPKVRPAAYDGAYHILCLGDSFAFGLGAEDGRGPCEHLAELLEAARASVTTFNRAVPGFNSSQAADALPAALIETQPDLVVVTVGHNNGWNFSGLHLEPGEGGLGVRLRCALGSLRLVKLLEFWFQYEDPAADDWLERLNRDAKAGKREGERERLLAFHQAHPTDVWTMVKLSELAREGGDAREEHRWREQAQAVDPAAVEAALQGLRRVDAWHAQNASHGVERHLVGREASGRALFHRLGQASLAEQQDFVHAVLRRDLADIVARSRAVGADVVISGYPSDKPANPVLAAAAEGMDVPFVDQHAIFSAEIERNGDPGRWFVLDGHCTSAGYQRVAKNLLSTVMSLGYRHPGIDGLFPDGFQRIGREESASDVVTATVSATAEGPWPVPLSSEGEETALGFVENTVGFCFWFAKQADPDLAGEMVLALDVAPDGRASGVRVVESTIGSPDLEACALNSVAMLGFPAPAEGLPPGASVHLLFHP